MATTTSAQQLPKLYIYDHCPFCVRARMILGLKHVEHELVFLASHDEATPIGLVGSKQAPILQLPSGKAFPESLDIVRYVDEHYGGAPILKEASGREDLKQWFAEAGKKSMYPLLLPRIVAAPFAEFALRASREYFQNKKEKVLGSFEELVTKMPELKAALEKSLEELETMIHSEKTVNADGCVSYDDIMLFGSLRGLTLIKDLKWPSKVRAYVDYYSLAADVPLLHGMATF